jgi:hypothetical protein
MTNSPLFLNLLFTLGVAASSIAFGQSTSGCNASNAGSLACITVDLTNTNQKALGLPVAANSGVDTGISLFTGQLSSAAPLPSPASGFVYAFDPATGGFTQSSASYGPVLSERAETIGAHRFSFGFVDQFFDFTKVDGIPNSNIPIEVTLGSNAYLAGNYSLHFRLNQFTMFATYGISNFVETSVAVPIINSQIGGSLSEHLHFGPATITAANTIDRSATGFGDLQFQVKANLFRRGSAGIALGTNIRTPTGDPYALTGAGALGIEPFLAASTTFHGWLAPHVNVGYQWNGQSVLAGDVVSGAKRNLPGSITYAAGAEIAINRRITLAEDLIGTELIHAERAFSGFIREFDGTTVQGVGFVHQSFNSTSVSSGLKFNPGGNVLLILNLLARVNSGGLRAAVVPTLGVSYVFRPPAASSVAPRLANTPARPPDVPPATPAAKVEPLDLDRMVVELNSKTNFAPNVPPAFTPFHNGRYLKLSLITTLPKSAAGSQYRLSALAFDQHIAHLIRPVLEYVKAHDDFDGIDFSTSVRLAGDQSPDSNPIAVEFIFPLRLLRTYAQYDSTGQQLIDGGFVLINGERVSLNLQIAEATFPSQ